MTEQAAAKEHGVSIHRANPSLEHLLGALVSYRHTLALLEERFNGDHASDKDNKKRLSFCKDKLDEAETGLTSFKLFRKVFFAWDLLHQVSEELILLLSPAELAAEGEKLALDLAISSLPEILKSGWIDRVKGANKRLSQLSPTPEDIEHARQTIRMALNVLNTQTDTLFWDIWTKKLSNLIYTVLLMIAIALFVFLCYQPGGFGLCVGNVLLLGAIGGLSSGIMSGEPQYLAKGHFWVSATYYSLVRPVQGALAAMIVFWMLQSQYIIKINPPLTNDSVTNCCYSSSPQAPQASTPDTPSNTNTTSNDSNVLITLNAAKGQEIYLHLLILLLAGFSGDKILKTVTDRTFSRLYSEADKTKGGT